MDRIELQFVNYTQAVALKKLGFPQHNSRTCDIYSPVTQRFYKDYNDYVDEFISMEDAIDAPYLETVAKWLRDKKDIILSVNYDCRDKSYICNFSYCTDIIVKDSYEDALSCGIDKVIHDLNNNIYEN